MRKTANPTAAVLSFSILFIGTFYLRSAIQRNRATGARVPRRFPVRRYMKGNRKKKRRQAPGRPPSLDHFNFTPMVYLHFENPQSRQKSQPEACSSWPRHSGHSPISFAISESGVSSSKFVCIFWI